MKQSILCMCVSIITNLNFMTTAGNVRVVLFEAEEVGGIYQNLVTHTEPLPDAPRLLKEGKKFWEQASVTTVVLVTYIHTYSTYIHLFLYLFIYLFLAPIISMLFYRDN